RRFAMAGVACGGVGRGRSGRCRQRSAGGDPVKHPAAHAALIFTPEYYERMRALEAGGWWNAGMRDAAARLLGLGPTPESGVALDVGCGSGQTMRWLREMRPRWRIQG